MYNPPVIIERLGIRRVIPIACVLLISHSAIAEGGLGAALAGHWEANKCLQSLNGSDWTPAQCPANLSSIDLLPHELRTPVGNFPIAEYKDLGDGKLQIVRRDGQVFPIRLINSDTFVRVGKHESGGYLQAQYQRGLKAQEGNVSDAKTPIDAAVVSPPNTSLEIEPGQYRDSKGDIYNVDRGPVTADGRTAYRVLHNKKLFMGLFLSGATEYHPFLPKGTSNTVSRFSEGPAYGFSADNWSEPFCLGALISLRPKGHGQLEVSGYRRINDTASRTCSFSFEQYQQTTPTHSFVLTLVSPDSSNSLPIGSSASLSAGEYTDASGEHLYKLKQVKQYQGRNVWLIDGGDKRNNFKGVSGMFVDGPPKGHPAFTGPNFSLHMPGGLIYGQLSKGWGKEPFCSGTTLAIFPMGKRIELISFAVITDRVSRTCMFVGPDPKIQEVPTGSITLVTK